MENYRCKLTDTAEVCFVCHQLSTAITVADNNSFAAYMTMNSISLHTGVFRACRTPRGRHLQEEAVFCCLVFCIAPFTFQLNQSARITVYTQRPSAQARHWSQVSSRPPPPGTWCGHRARHRAQGTKKGYSHERTAEQSGINSLLHREAI